MTPYPTTKKKPDGGTYLYKCYRCPVARTPQLTGGDISCTMKRTITEGRLEEAVLAKIKEQLGAHIVAMEESTKDRAKKDKSVDAKISRLQAKLSRANELYIEGGITKEDYDQRSVGIRAEIEALEASKVSATEEQIAQAQSTLDAFASFGEIYDTLSAAEKNVLFRNIIQYISLDTETLEMDFEFL